MSMVLRYRGTGSGGTGSPVHTAGPIKHYQNCKWRILIDESPAVDTGSVRGILEFFKIRKSNSSDDECPVQEFNSLRIQLEGFARTRFTIKTGNRRTSHRDEHQFLPTSPNDPNYPFNFDFIKDGQETDVDFKSVGTSLHIFPFEIFLRNTAENFPAGFFTDYGRIEYLLVVYANGFPCADKHLWKNLTLLGGHFNFPPNSDLYSKEISVANQIGTCLMARGPKLQAILNLSQKGYLPGELMSFRIQVDNPNEDQIEKLSVSVVQIILYFAGQASKQVSTVLDARELQAESRADVAWEDMMELPEELMPTFTPSKKSVQVWYFLEFKVSVLGKAELKGKAGIVVGTRREEIDAELNHHWDHGSWVRSPGPSRRQSAVDLTGMLTPPAYSSFSRRPSSSELSPPAYTDAIASRAGIEDLDDQPRPRCNSNVM